MSSYSTIRLEFSVDKKIPKEKVLELEEFNHGNCSDENHENVILNYRVDVLLQYNYGVQRIFDLLLILCEHLDNSDSIINVGSFTTEDILSYQNVFTVYIYRGNFIMVYEDHEYHLSFDTTHYKLFSVGKELIRYSVTNDEFSLKDILDRYIREVKL